MDKIRSLEKQIQKLKEKREQIKMHPDVALTTSTKPLKRLNQQITKAEDKDIEECIG